MQYLLLIYSNEAADANATEEESTKIYQAYNDYTKELRDSGAYLAGEALLPTSTATTVRRKDGKPLTTHGPFAETTEQLGGFYMVECANIDQALEWAAKCPGSINGAVEVRPVMVFE